MKRNSVYLDRTIYDELNELVRRGTEIEQENAQLKARIAELEKGIRDAFGTPAVSDLKQCVADLAKDTHRLNYLTSLSGPLYVESEHTRYATEELPAFFDWRASVDKWMAEANGEQVEHRKPVWAVTRHTNGKYEQIDLTGNVTEQLSNSGSATP